MTAGEPADLDLGAAVDAMEVLGAGNLEDGVPDVPRSHCLEDGESSSRSGGRCPTGKTSLMRRSRGPRRPWSGKSWSDGPPNVTRRKVGERRTVRTTSTSKAPTARPSPVAVWL